MKTENLKYHLLRVFLKTFASLPLGVLYRISDLASFILYRVMKYRIKVVRNNLAMTFPEKSVEELRTIERRFYGYLCDVFVEAAKLAHISDEEIERRVRIRGLEEMNDVMKSGKSIVLLLGHYGNWEWVTCAARKLVTGGVMCEIYHPLSDKAMDRLMLDLRGRFGTENIPMKHTLRRLLQIHQEGKNFACGFISDQRPFTDDLRHWVDFFGIDTPYVNGGEVIGTRVGTEFFYAEMCPEKRGHYTLTFSRLHPIQDGQENPYTRAYWHKLEDSIRRNPPFWLWSHNRWVHPRSFAKRATEEL